MDVHLVSLPYFLPKRFRLFKFPSFSVFHFLKFPLFLVYCLSNIPYFHPRWPKFIDIYTMLTQHCATLMQSIVSSFCNSELFSYFLAILLLTCSIICKVLFLVLWCLPPLIVNHRTLFQLWLQWIWRTWWVKETKEVKPKNLVSHQPSGLD